MKDFKIPSLGHERMVSVLQYIRNTRGKHGVSFVFGRVDCGLVGRDV